MEKDIFEIGQNEGSSERDGDGELSEWAGESYEEKLQNLQNGPEETDRESQEKMKVKWSLSGLDEARDPDGTVPDDCHLDGAGGKMFGEAEGNYLQKGLREKRKTDGEEKTSKKEKKTEEGEAQTILVQTYQMRK